MSTTDLYSRKWFNFGRWIQPPLAGAFWAHWHESKSAQALLSEDLLSPILFLDGFTLLPESHMGAIHNLLSDALAEKTISRIWRSLEEVGARAEQAHVALLADTALSPEAYARRVFETYLEMVGVWVYCFSVAPHVESIAKEKGLAVSDEEILNNVAPFVRITWLEQQIVDVKKLAQAVRGKHPVISPEQVTKSFFYADDELKKNLARIVSSYAWFGTHHWGGEGYTEEQCVNDVQRVLKEPSEEKMIPVSSSSSSEEDFWKLIASLMYWRTHCAEVTTKVIFHSRKKLTDIALQWGIDYEALTYLTATEIENALDRGSLVLSENYNERRNGYGVLIEEMGERVIVGTELAKAINTVVPKVDRTISEIKGAVGSRGGVVHGVAKVILSPSDFGKFQDGDILIGNDTTPDFVPLMKKALAIVTDTGGITSHAAIVSRELRKPCVIGTKIATQVFKDGDLVEVNAQTGIVTLLKK